ncbi:MAG: BrxA/BrxB family bacilliredoxin [Flavobacteriales bacterium]|jgi:putative YphP/YqiW family bacilliredoxin|nr:BrxA/BrxB family bacilliredoxin [Flavobacteriales bacterium]
MYPPELVAPMKAELVNSGYEDVTTTDTVDQYLNGEGTTFVVINSVCGCAASNARPAAKMAKENAKTPDNFITVFAGVDGEAVNQVRKYCLPYPPSSPSMALFKDGQLVHFVERHHIEGVSAEMIAENITAAFDEFC